MGLTKKRTIWVVNAAKNRQRGIVLFIALIVLIALSLAGIAIIRSSDTANVIAGNLAFKQGTLNAGDLGIERAIEEIPWVAANTLDNNQTPAADSNPARPYWYFASQRELDGFGVPTMKEDGTNGGAIPIDWQAVPAIATVSGNTVQVVIDRLCQGPLPVNNIEDNCFADSTVDEGQGTKKAHESVFSMATSVYFRVTVRIAGPRNTSSMIQAIVTG